MKNPNGYGSVYKLSGNRRKPWAARVTIGFEYSKEKDRDIQKYKIIGYSETRKEAMKILSEYNAGITIKETISISSLPTFKEVYKEWSALKFEGMSHHSYRNYELAFRHCELLHNKKMINLRPDDLQEVINSYKDKSKSTVLTIKTIMNQIYAYAMKKEYVEKDYSKYLSLTYQKPDKEMHSAFSKDEIAFLWDNINRENVDLILMMCYTGVRPVEFVKIKNENVHLDKGYFRAGVKTESGKNRIIPICSKIQHLFEKHYNSEHAFLLTKSNLRSLTERDKMNYYTYETFHKEIWNPTMNMLNMNHLPHDPRHTFASMMDRVGANPICTKRIMGHKIQDITAGTYTHKDIEDLKSAIELL